MEVEKYGKLKLGHTARKWQNQSTHLGSVIQKPAVLDFTKIRVTEIKLERRRQNGKGKKKREGKEKKKKSNVYK